MPVGGAMSAVDEAIRQACDQLAIAHLEECLAGHVAVQADVRRTVRLQLTHGAPLVVAYVEVNEHDRPVRMVIADAQASPSERREVAVEPGCTVWCQLELLASRELRLLRVRDETC